MTTATALRLGRRTASRSGHHFQLAAILVNRSGKLVAISENRVKTDPFMDNNPWLKQTCRKAHKVTSLHAEVAVCRGIPEEDLKGADIFVVRLSRSRGVGNSRPCPICFAYLKSLQLRRLFYTQDDGTFATERF